MLRRRVQVLLVLSALFSVSSCQFRRRPGRNFVKGVAGDLTPKTSKISLPVAGVAGDLTPKTPKISLPVAGVSGDLTPKTPGIAVSTKKKTTPTSKVSATRNRNPVRKTPKKTEKERPRNKKRKDRETRCSTVKKDYAIYSCVSETEVFCTGWSTKRVKLDRCHCVQQRRPRLTVCSAKWCQGEQCNLEGDVCHSKDIPIKPKNCTCENPSLDGTHCEQ